MVAHVHLRCWRKEETCSSLVHIARWKSVQEWGGEMLGKGFLHLESRGKPDAALSQTKQSSVPFPSPWPLIS